jgi:hypothetical protein
VQFVLTQSQSKKKKKKKSAGDPVIDPVVVVPKSTKSRPRVQEASKSKGKQKTKDDDFEKALAELTGK